MTSSSSSASDDTVIQQTNKRKSKKSKKEKQHRKNMKNKSKSKSKKDDKKAKKEKSDKSAIWDYDRSEAIRLVGQLLSYSADICEELMGVVEALDKGEIVSIDGLENKQIKKKVRHLLQALKLVHIEGKGFQSPNRRVSFAALLDACVSEATSLGVDPALPAQEAPACTNLCGTNPEMATKQELHDPIEDVVEHCGDETVQEPSKPRVKGPQLPLPCISSNANVPECESSEESEEGPRIEGTERQGVDLDGLPEVAQHEEWMSMPHAEIAGAFIGEPGKSAKKEQFAVGRSEEERAAFEDAFKKRGPSLLQQVAEGNFSDSRDEVERRHKKQKSSQDLWGRSAREQQRQSADNASCGGAMHRSFDPEKDLKTVKPISGEDFSRLVSNSNSDLAGRFGRGHFTTSFL